MTGAASVPPGAHPPAPTVRGVIRAAGGILRRHAAPIALLALALGVAPALLLYASAEPVRRATSPGVDTLQADLFALMVYVAYIGGFVLTRCLALAGDVAVALIGLETDRPPGPPSAQVRAIVLRLVAFSLATLIAGEALYAWPPAPLGLCAYVMLNCWTVMVPVYAAERPPLPRLVGRSWAVFARGGRVMAAILAAYCIGAVCISTAYLHLYDLVGRGAVALWIGVVVVEAASAVFGTGINLMVVALYRELLPGERALLSSTLVEAFE